MGEKTLPKMHPPRTAPKQCVSMGTLCPPSVHASGPTRGKRMPMVPKDDPVAKEMTYARTDVRGASPQAGSPPEVSALARKVAVPVAAMMEPSAQANDRTTQGSITSRMPSVKAVTASPRFMIFCERSSVTATTPPRVLPHKRALTLSQAERAATKEWGPAVPIFVSAFFPSITIPENAAMMIVIKGTIAFVARRGVDGSGSRGPGAMAEPSSCCDACFCGVCSIAFFMAPKSLSVVKRATTNASIASGKIL
mmetsp:Transcript_15852/g.21374  ORF Transcript_15852/g.21374 Transcript_15852/m.21374 type:complete len:252 (-) Transcript_15852:862-1617(-)